MAKLPEDRRAIFTDVYKFYESHWDMPFTVEAWEQAARDVAELVRKHDSNPLMIKLVFAAYDAISDEQKVMMEVI